MAYPKWFNEVEYLNNKLGHLQKIGAKDANGSEFTSISQVADAFKAAGTDPYSHYNAYGSAEGLSPSVAFNAQEYCEFKLRSLQNDPATKSEWTGKSWQDVQYGINKAGMSLGQHYAQYGAVEGVSMSNAFDTNVYLAAKLDLLKAADKTWEGKTVKELATAFKDLGLDPYTHYLTYKGTGAQEVSASFDVSSKDPVQGGGGSTKFVLTAGTDTLTGTASNDVFIADVDPSANSNGATTLNATDSINGGEGIDTLKAYGNNNIANLGTASIRNVEIIQAIGGTGAIDTSSIADVKEVWTIKGTNPTMTLAAGQAVGVEGSNGTVTVNVKGTDGSSDLLNVLVKDANVTSLALSAAAGNVKIDKMSIAASGANVITAITAADAKELVLTGKDGSFALTDAATGLGKLEAIDASGYGGDVVIGKGTAITQTVTTKYTGGTGEDKVYIADNFSSKEAAAKYNGGEGDAIDTLVIGTETNFSATEAGFINSAKNWDVLELAAAQVTALSAGDFNINDFVFSAKTDTMSTQALNITGIKSNDSFTFKADVGQTTNSATAGAAGAIGLKVVGATGGFENITITLDDAASIQGQNGDSNSSSVAGKGGAALDASAYDKLIIESVGDTHKIAGGAGGVGTGQTGGAGGDAINNIASKEVVINGDADLTIAGGAGGSGSTAGAAGNSFANSVNLNAAEFHGKLTTGGSASVDKIVVGDGGSVITATASKDLIKFGAGSDKYVLSAIMNGNSTTDMDTVDGFTAGSDKIAFGAGAAAPTAFATKEVAGTGTLATDLGSALSGNTTGGKLFVITITGGSDAGVYAVQDKGSAGTFDVANDFIVSLTGVEGTLTAADFLV